MITASLRLYSLTRYNALFSAFVFVVVFLYRAVAYRALCGVVARVVDIVRRASLFACPLTVCASSLAVLAGCGGLSSLHALRVFSSSSARVVLPLVFVNVRMPTVIYIDIIYIIGIM